MGEDGDARLGIGGAAAEQPAIAHRAGEGRRAPLAGIAGRRGIDAGVEAEHGAGRGAGDLDQHRHRLARRIVEQARCEAVLGEPRLHQRQHRLRRIDAGAGRRRHQPRRQLDDAVCGCAAIDHFGKGISAPQRFPFAISLATRRPMPPKFVPSLPQSDRYQLGGLTAFRYLSSHSWDRRSPPCPFQVSNTSRPSVHTTSKWFWIVSGENSGVHCNTSRHRDAG